MSTIYEDEIMDPATMMLALGFGTQLMGGIMGTRSQSKAYEEAASAARTNAMAAKMKAAADADQQMLQANAVFGAQTAGYAAAGVEGGSPIAVMADSMASAEMDRLNILFGGKVKGDAYSAQANASMDAASDIRRGGLFSTLATGFQAAGTFAKKDG